MLLLGVFAVVVLVAGYVFGAYYGDATSGLTIAGVFTILYGVIAYFSGDQIALAVSGAKKIEKKDNNELYSLVDNLAISAGLPTPALYMIDSPALNAFATGRDPKHAAIAVTSGLLEKLNKRELKGVLAHEMSHVGNYDIRLQTLVIILAGVFTLMSDFFLRSTFYGGHGNRSRGGGKAGAVIIVVALVLAVLSPIIAMVIQLAISRKREFLADHTGAILISDPEALASALEKIARDPNELKTASKATAHLFISDPLKKSFFSGLFATHPPIQERIKILRNI